MSALLRILHTSDWHLGHQLHGISRAFEHRVFLDWLLERLVVEEVDALVITGDIFDVANPSTAALATWYGFLGQARRRCPTLDILVIGGNHDSAQRLDAPRPLLEELDITVIGGMRWIPGAGPGGRALDADAMVIPLHDRTGAVAAWVAAVPFIRMSDLGPARDLDGDPVEAGVTDLYDTVIGAARLRKEPGQALLATGHLKMADYDLNDSTERPVLAGSGIPLSVFPRDLAYVALGHIHLAGRVGDVGHVRYAGSPFPLSLTETAYAHQVVLVDLDGQDFHRLRVLPTPRPVDLVRIGPAPLDDVLAQVAAFPERTAETEGSPEVEARLPIVQAVVRLEVPIPDLRTRIDEAARGKAIRLCRITVERNEARTPLAETLPGEVLEDLSCEEVFLRRYAQQHPGVEAPAPLLAAFRELVDEVHQSGVLPTGGLSESRDAELVAFPVGSEP